MEPKEQYEWTKEKIASLQRYLDQSKGNLEGGTNENAKRIFVRELEGLRTRITEYLRETDNWQQTGGM